MTNQTRLVPVEPTWEMLIVGRDALINAITDDSLDTSVDDARACWTAMLSAAPQQPDDLSSALAAKDAEIERLRQALRLGTLNLEEASCWVITERWSADDFREHARAGRRQLLRSATPPSDPRLDRAIEALERIMTVEWVKGYRRKDGQSL